MNPTASGEGETTGGDAAGTPPTRFVTAVVPVLAERLADLPTTVAAWWERDEPLSRGRVTR